MTTVDIANRLVEICRSGQFDDAYHELFSPDAVAYEMEGYPDRITKGIDALLAKSKGFAEEVKEMHALEITDPLVMGDQFAVGMMLDMTKKDGKREKAEEICVYEVKNGKIVSERFLYSMG